ncbi:MAG: hypothetical protein JXR86_16910 [Spirochaetales bacterium]|nr:hypothetical protein [Spirochaetales bacterium]
MMSTPGKADEGYALLDVLIALLIIVLGFGSLFGALRTAGDLSIRYEKAVITGLDERNRRADDFGK